ncbi:MAG: InlB B-repeat-containing protein, partial [Bacilli bacterium]|nr:InlB B-repeat-containing protein [Bacilli bacterium]
NNGEKAVLVHYTSFDDQGQMDNSSTRGNYEYEAGKIYLPNSTTWSNPALTAFDGKVSRYISHEDLLAACGGTEISYNNNQYLSTCQFFLETSRYQSSSLGRSGIWLETLNNNLYRIQTSTVVVEIPSTIPSKNTVRPVIEIPITSLEEYIAELEYTITFDTHGGTPVASITKHAGETLGNIVTTREHYDFDGWYANYENDIYSNQVTASTVITEDMTLHAKWQPKETHIVKFDADGGTINGEPSIDLIVDHGDTVSASDIPEPTYTGMTFDGWFIDGDSTTPFTSSTVINDDMTVVAAWSVTSNYVARVNGTGYETLAGAIAAVPTTGVKTTVTILKDITLTEGVTIPSTKWVELDIGQKTITGSFSAAGDMITNSGKLDIISGEMIFTNYDSTKATKIIVNNSGATLNISGNCTLTNEGTNTTNNTVDHPVFENKGGTINITGGVLNSNGFAASINNNSGTINMSGGRIIAHSETKGQAIYMAGGTVNISGNAYLENTSGT